MVKRAVILAAIIACLVPAALRAGLGFGVGVYASAVSMGLEGRINIPAGRRTGIFIAPHGFWRPTSRELKAQFPEEAKDSGRTKRSHVHAG